MKYETLFSSFSSLLHPVLFVVKPPRSMNLHAWGLEVADALVVVDVEDQSCSN